MNRICEKEQPWDQLSLETNTTNYWPRESNSCSTCAGNRHPVAMNPVSWSTSRVTSWRTQLNAFPKSAQHIWTVGQTPMLPIKARSYSWSSVPRPRQHPCIDRTRKAEQCDSPVAATHPQLPVQNAFVLVLNTLLLPWVLVYVNKDH